MRTTKFLASLFLCFHNLTLLFQFNTSHFITKLKFLIGRRKSRSETTRTRSTRTLWMAALAILLLHSLIKDNLSSINLTLASWLIAVCTADFLNKRFWTYWSWDWLFNFFSLSSSELFWYVLFLTKYSIISPLTFSLYAWSFLFYWVHETFLHLSYFMFNLLSFILRTT